MRYITPFSWLLCFIGLFLFLQYNCEYHFYWVEQNQLFQNTWHYISEKLVIPGGLSLVTSEYLVQFFILPYAGPAITAFLLIATGVLAQIIIKKITSGPTFFLFYLLLPITLLFIHFSFNYLVFGTVAYIFMQLLLIGGFSIRNSVYRIGYEILMTPVLWCMAGPIALLFSICIVVYELLNKTPKGYLSLITIVEVFALGLFSVNAAIFGEFRFILLPDGYYHDRLTPEPVIYFSWIVLPLSIAVTTLLKNRSERSRKRWLAETGTQIIVVVGLLIWGIPEYIDAKSYQVKAFDYYSRTEQWDKIIEGCQGPLKNYLYLCYLNRALAEKGELANRMFYYDQRGLRGITVAWNKSASISTLLSDIYFTMGDVASAQQMAFEASISQIGDGNPRVVKRLVETNLIYGEYAVAEKYIRLLENTWYYKNWATEQRRFLYNDGAIERDPLLGDKRRTLPEKNFLSQLDGIDYDLKRFAEANPSSKTAIEYVGAIYLLAKDLERFKDLVETYYGTEVLPVLPFSFQEAIITLFENEPEVWKHYQIEPYLVEQFAGFKKQVVANRNNPSALPGLLNRAFGHTYWFYFMFKQND